MKTVRSVFGKVLVSFMLVLGLTAASCQQRGGNERVNDDMQENEDVRIRERQNNDSVDIQRDQIIREEDDGYGDTKVRDNTEIEMERDRTPSQGSSDRPANQGNDRGAEKR